LADELVPSRPPRLDFDEQLAAADEPPDTSLPPAPPDVGPTEGVAKPPAAGAKPPSEKPEAPTQGEEGRSVDQIAADYLVPISDEAAKAWKGHEDQYLEYAKQIATGMFPTFAPQIAQGLAPRVLVDPYVQIAKATLGDDTEPDWTDPMWMHVLDGTVDQKTGRPTLMPLSQFKLYLVSEPGLGFDHSPAASSRAQGFSQAMNDAFSGGEPRG